jgi:hypothetical protein
LFILPEGKKFYNINACGEKEMRKQVENATERWRRNGV